MFEGFPKPKGNSLSGAGNPEPGPRNRSSRFNTPQGCTELIDNICREQDWLCCESITAAGCPEVPKAVWASMT